MTQHEYASTRIWWDGREVNFIRWTDGTLVFAWRENDETAMHIPRGAVTRLIDRGVLEVEGDLPAWLGDVLTLDVPAREPEPVKQPVQKPVAPARREVARPAPAPARQHNQPAPATSRRSIVARLLRKLGGDPDRVQARSNG